MQKPSLGREGMKSWAGGTWGERLGPCVPLSVTEKQGLGPFIPFCRSRGGEDGKVARLLHIQVAVGLNGAMGYFPHSWNHLLLKDRAQGSPGQPFTAP